MQQYIQTARQRAQAYKFRLDDRYAQAGQVARQAAQLLKSDFEASRIVLFGSCLVRSRIHLRSDIDLAVWDLDEKLCFKAVARLQDLDPNFDIDLVEFHNAYPYIQAAIEQGIDL
ncbi:MAG: nucleotidyltransferase domain-containing protein [Thermosynechococcaceae cyanobacterium]